MKYKIKHTTKYIYQSPVSLCHNIACQTPRVFSFQNVENHKLDITPEPNSIVKRKDFFENECLYFSVQKTHKELIVKSTSIVEVKTPEWIGIDPKLTMPWEEVATQLKSIETLNDIRQFYLESPHVIFNNEIKEYTLQFFKPGRPILEAMIELNQRIFKDFKFTPNFTDISTPVDEVFKTKKGVCQDFAHFGLSCLRSIGLAARYISGYIETIPPKGETKMVGSDASHAWIALYVPGNGWIEFDSTNNLIVNDQHIRVAIGRDFSDIVPLKGIVYSSGNQKMEVKVDVNKID